MKRESTRMGIKKLLWSAVYTVLMAAAVSIPVYAEETVYVNCDVLRCRSEAEIKDNNIVARVYRGEELKKVGVSGEWTQVVVNGERCYVASQYLSAEKPAMVMHSAENTVSADQQTEPAVTEPELYEPVGLSSLWKYAEFSKVNSGQAVLYHTNAAEKRNKTICVNAGHGTSGGSGVKTLCHPDGSPKVTGGTTGAGATKAAAVSGGMTFSDGTPEAEVTLAMAKILKERLLKEGYDVLMIRETDDVQLDNIARTVIANNNAHCHIALHWDSTSSNKGAFYMSVPSDKTYRAMEPVASQWQEHNRLGEALVGGLRDAGVKIFSGGSMEMDLTQTSFSTIPSIDIELGDKESDHSEATLSKLADGLLAGVNRFFAE